MINFVNNKTEEQIIPEMLSSEIYHVVSASNLTFDGYVCNDDIVVLINVFTKRASCIPVGSFVRGVQSGVFYFRQK